MANKTINNRDENPNWPEANQLAFDKRCREFELGISRTNQLAVSVGLGASELQPQHSNRLATLPRREREKLNLYRSSGECDSYEGREIKEKDGLN